MKKIIVSMAIALCMIMVILPNTVHAESPEIYVGNTNVSTASSTPVYWKAATEGSDAYASTGTSDDYLFSVALDKTGNGYTLTLNGVNITTDYDYSGIYTAGDLNIVLADDKTNTIVMPGEGHSYYGVKASGSINISSGGKLDVTVNSDLKYHEKFGIYSMDGITITGGEINVIKYGRCGDAIYAEKDIRVLGTADITLVDWSKSDGAVCGFHSNGNVAVGESATLNLCSQSKGVYARDKVYIGYLWDAASNGGAGGYVESGNPTITINDTTSIAAITPDVADDFTAGPDGIWAYRGVHIAGGKVSAAGENGIYCEVGKITISGSGTDVTICAQGNKADTYYGIRSASVLTITDAKITVTVTQAKALKYGIFSDEEDIRISGEAEVSIVSWGDSGQTGIATPEYSQGNFAVGGSAQINVCTQSLGIISYGRAYIGYVWDANANGGAGGYVPDGNPTVRINNAAAVAAITPNTADDFQNAFIGFAGLVGIDMAGGSLETAGEEYAVVSEGTVSYTGPVIPTILAAKYAGTSIGAAELSNVIWVNDDASTFKYKGDLISYIKIGTISDITKGTATGGSYTVKVNGEEAVNALAGDTVTLSAAPDSGYTFSSWKVYKTSDAAVKVKIKGNTFIMPAYPVTVEAAFSTSNSSSGSSHTQGSNTPSKTIAVTESSSSLFQNSNGQIKAEANMSNAFSNSVEVKVTNADKTASEFSFGAGKEVYPFDISLYIKGTNNKTKPNDGYAVTISLPVPEKLLGQKELLTIVHKADNGEVTTLPSKLLQNNGVWYLVFEAKEFSPYALILSNTTTYDESAGIPYYIDSAGRTVYIGFAANGKYLAPDGVIVKLKDNSKSFTDVNKNWAAGYINFVAEREIFVGSGTNTFSPNLGMTRAMFATVIGRLYERSYGAINTSDTNAFTDCSYDKYYGKYVNWAAEKGIISGYGNGQFGPNDKITREQMAAILYRFVGFLGASPNNVDTTLKYTDSNTISNWAGNAALYCQGTGIIAGRDGGYFVPKSVATRAEVATILQRFIEKTVK